MHLTGRLLVVVLAAGLSACAARGGVPRPFPGAALPPGAEVPPEVEHVAPPAEVAAQPSPADPQATLPPVAAPSVVALALGYRGVPYRNGGSDPSGFDCSGFVQYVFKQVGAILPREVRDQVHVGRLVNRDDVQPGDLLFFRTAGDATAHVGLAIGSDAFVHAPSSNGVVRVERLTVSYWSRRFVEARRLFESQADQAAQNFPFRTN